MSISATCTKCSAPIFWSLSEKSKKMPMDSTPSRDGAFRLEDRPGENPTAIFVHEADRADWPRLYVCHFNTCGKSGTAK